MGTVRQHWDCITLKMRTPQKPILINRISSVGCDLIIRLENMDINEKLTVVIVKEYRCESIVKGFHVYKEIWKPVETEILDTMQPENPKDKYAVCVENNGKIVGHLPKGKKVASARRFSFS